MGFVLELQFDLPSEIFIKSLMQQLKDIGLASNLLEKAVTPHLTLLSSKTMLGEDDLEKLNEVLSNQSTFSLTAVSLSTFVNKEGVLFVGVVVHQPLLSLHKAVYGCVNQAELHPYYLSDRWVPHITLATTYSREQLAQAVERLELTLPQELQVSSLALVEYPAPLKQLKTWLFTKTSE